MGYIVGMAFILLGILVKYFPNGINILTSEEKRKTDMKRLASFFCRGFICLGIAGITFQFFCNLLKYPLSYSFLVLPPFFIGLVTVIAIGLQKSKKKA